MASEGGVTEPLVADDIEARGPNGAQPYTDVSFWDIAVSFTTFGWTAFGGPQAHLGMFETTLVEKYKWISSAVFIELFALCACLPGPTSTQVAYSIGAVKRGVLGGLISGSAFLYPGFSMMSTFGMCAGWYLKEEPDWLRGVVDGLAAAGLALVAVAAQKLSLKVCKDNVTVSICIMSAVLAYLFEASWLFPVLIIAGGFITLAYHTVKNTDLAHTSQVEDEENGGLKSYGLTGVTGAMLLIFWFIVLVSVGAIRALTDYKDKYIQPLYWFESFYRIGSLVYGGGQVVLPMLITEVCRSECHMEKGVEVCGDHQESWVTVSQFKAGLAIIHAMPGPMFNFAAYLGAVIAIRAKWNFMLGAFVASLGLVGPGIMLTFAVLPFWGNFRVSNLYRRCLPGLNSAAVGLVISAVFSMYDKFKESSIFPKTTTAIGIIGFCLVNNLKMPAPFAIVIGGILGVLGILAGLKEGA